MKWSLVYPVTIKTRKCFENWVLNIVKAVTKSDLLLLRACCLVPASCAWHMISVLPQELQSPGYPSASASGKPRHVVPLPCLYSAAMPLPLNLASCAPHMSTRFIERKCTDTGMFQRLKITWRFWTGKHPLETSKSSFLVPKTKSLSIASHSLWSLRFYFFLLVKYMKKNNQTIKNNHTIDCNSNSSYLHHQ